MDLFYGKKVTKRAKKGKARTKARTKGRKMTLAKLRLFAKKRRVSVYKRRGGKKVLLNKKQLMAKLLKMRIKIKQRFGMATVCRENERINKRYRAKRGQKQCLKVKPKISLASLQSLAFNNDVSIYKRRRDNMGFTKSKLSMKALKARLTRLKVPYSASRPSPDYIPEGVPVYEGYASAFGMDDEMEFGMATVCRADQRINKRYIGKRGQKQCIQLKSKTALKRLQKLAKANEIAIINKKTGKKLTIKALKARLTRMKVFHFGA